MEGSTSAPIEDRAAKQERNGRREGQNKSEDHALKNGVEFADYIRRVDVPGSQFAFNLRGRQVRYLTIQPERKEKVKELEFIKGPDDTAPLIVAVTIESP